MRTFAIRNDYKMKRTVTIIYFALLFTKFGIAQQSAILDSYIKQGLDNNLAIQQQNLNLEKSLLALKEANGLFYPNISLESQYTSAKGGRSIDLPIGDLLNPVYSSLNQILQNMGNQGGFPQIDNQKIQFLPNDYHDSKMRIILPLINAEIYYNRKIKREMQKGKYKTADKKGIIEISGDYQKSYNLKR